MKAFPGAMGYGSDTVHGSGRGIGPTTVYKVTNLDPGNVVGSLRRAIEATGPRVVIFEVSGVIQFTSDIVLANNYCWIAGQTAPFPGITVRGVNFRITAKDFLIQHIKFRPGDDLNNSNPGDRHGIDLFGADMGLIDHCSVSWGIDECVTTVNGTSNVTISNTLIAECLYNSIHPQGLHSMGFLIRENTDGVAFLRSLIMSNRERNPKITENTSAIMANSVFYNAGMNVSWCQIRDGYGEGPSYVTARRNKFIKGPNTPEGTPGICVYADMAPGTEVFTEANLTENTGPVLDDKLGIVITAQPTAWENSIALLPALETEDYVTANVGAFPASRDHIDTRLISELTSRTGSIKNSVAEAGGYPTESNYRSLNPPTTDKDVVQASGYTLLEEWVHGYSQIAEGTGSGGGGGTEAPIVYYTDFSTDTTGTTPANSTLQWQPGTWTVLANDTLQQSDAVTGRYCLSFDDAGTPSLPVDVVVKTRPMAARAGTGIGPCRVVVYGNGDAASAYGYFAGLSSDLSGAFGVAKYVGGTYTELGWSTGHSFVAAEAWVRIRLRVEAGVIRARIWEDGTEEPTAWHVTAPDVSLSSGFIGIGNQTEASEFDFVGIATGGDEAPQAQASVSGLCSDGIKASDGVVGGDAGIFVSDTFTDSDGTLLENHTGEIGAGWVKYSGSIEIQSNKAEKV